MLGNNQNNSKVNNNQSLQVSLPLGVTVSAFNQNTQILSAIINDIIALSSKLDAQTNHPEYPSILEKYRILTNKEDGLIILKMYVALLVSATASSTEFSDPQELTNAAISLRNRINAIYFFLECVFPFFEEEKDLKYRYVISLIDSIGYFYSYGYSLMITDKDASVPADIAMYFYDSIKGLLPIFKKYEPDLKKLYDNILDGQPTFLSEKLLSQFKKNLLPCYSNLILLNCNYGNFCAFFKDKADPLTIYEKVKFEYDFLQTHTNKLIALSSMSIDAAQKYFEHMLQEIANLMQHCEAKEPLPYEACWKQVFHFQDEFENLINNIKQGVFNGCLALETMDFINHNIKQSMALADAWTSNNLNHVMLPALLNTLRSLSDASQEQTKELQPKIRDLINKWRDVFEKANLPYALLTATLLKNMQISMIGAGVALSKAHKQYITLQTKSIRNAARPIEAQILHPDYAALLEEHKVVLASKDGILILEEYLVLIRHELDEVKANLYAPTNSVLPILKMINYINALLARINATYFFIDRVLPLHSEAGKELKARYINILIDDITNAFLYVMLLRIPNYNNQVSNNADYHYYQIAKRLFTLFEKHVPEMENLYGCILNKEPTCLSEATLTQARLYLYSDYANLVRVYSDFAAITFPFEERSISTHAFLQAKRLFAFLKTNLNKIIHSPLDEADFLKSLCVKIDQLKELFAENNITAENKQASKAKQNVVLNVDSPADVNRFTLLTYENGKPISISINIVEVVDDIINTTCNIHAQIAHPNYAALFKKYEPYFTSKVIGIEILSEYHDRLKQELPEIQKEIIRNILDPKQIINIIKRYNKRINSNYFFIEQVLPHHQDKIEHKLLYLNIFFEDLTTIFKYIAEAIKDNELSFDEKYELYQLTHSLFSIFEKHKPDVKQMLDNCLVNNNIGDVSETTSNEAKRTLFQGYSNLVKIPCDYAFLCNYFLELDKAKQAFVDSKVMFNFIANKKRKQKIGVITKEGRKSIESQINENLIPKFTFLDQFYQTTTIPPYKKELKQLHDFRLTFENILKNIKAGSFETLSIDEFYVIILNIKKNIKDKDFTHALSDMAQLEDCNREQAQQLLLLIDELLSAWCQTLTKQKERDFYKNLMVELIEHIKTKAIQTKDFLAEKYTNISPIVIDSRESKSAASAKKPEKNSEKLKPIISTIVNQAKPRLNNNSSPQTVAVQQNNKALVSQTMGLNNNNNNNNSEPHKADVHDPIKRIKVPKESKISSKKLLLQSIEREKSQKKAKHKEGKKSPNKANAKQVLKHKKEHNSPEEEKSKDKFSREAFAMHYGKEKQENIKPKAPSMAQSSFVSIAMASNVKQPLMLGAQTDSDNLCIHLAELSLDEKENLGDSFMPIETFSVEEKENLSDLFIQIETHDGMEEKENASDFLMQVEPSPEEKSPIFQPCSTHLQYKPTSVRITMDPMAKTILTLLNAQGYWAVLCGGAVRDLVSNKKPNDWDITTNCPKERLSEIIHEAKVNLSDKSGSRFKVSDTIDISCTTLGIEAELLKRDFYENTLIADRDGCVYDVLNKIHLLLSRNHNYKLHAIGNVDNLMSKDPSIALRLVRLTMQAGKNFSDYLNSLNKIKHFITKLDFGIYLKNFKELFARGNALMTWQALNDSQLTDYLLPGAAIKRFASDLSFLPFNLFMQEKLFAIDHCADNERKAHYSAHHYITLLMLPEMINLQFIEPLTSVKEHAKRMVIFFCENYIGEMAEGDKLNFKKKVKALLQENYSYYQNMLPRYYNMIMAHHHQQLIQHSAPLMMNNSPYFIPQFQTRRDQINSTQPTTTSSTTMDYSQKYSKK